MASLQPAEVIQSFWLTSFHSMLPALQSPYIPPPAKMTVLRYIKTPLIDIIASVLLWWGTSIASAVIQPAHVGFSCDDVSIRKPRVPEIVSSMVLHWVTLLVPILCFVIVELVKIYLIDQDEEFADGEIRQSKLTRVVLRVLHVISWHFLTMAITELLTTVAKLSVGRLRPYFLEVCRPAVDTESCATRPIYITHYECTDPNGSSTGARKSFFSGHSSNSMAAATFVVLYIQGRLGNELTTRSLIPIIQAFIFSAGLFVGFSRYVDHSHHWSDIFVGQTVGVLIATIIVFKATPLFKKDKFY